MDYPQLEMLDDELALRVARLVVECSAPVDLALAAVQDAQTHADETRARDHHDDSFLKRLLFY